MRSPKKKPFSNSRKRSKFKIINWPEYNNILRNRGRIDLMISKNLGENWYEQNNNNKNVEAKEDIVIKLFWYVCKLDVCLN